jgi:putative copper export protein/mono/diheme cytochrome c family protein
MDTMIVAARTVHFAAAILLFGQLLFALAVATPVWRDAGRVALEQKQRLLPLALVCGAWALGASVISGAGWLVAEAALMSGLPVAQVIGGDTIGVVLGSTAFGRLWIWRFGLSLVLGALLLAIGRSSGKRLRRRLAVGGALVAAAYLATLAWAGHAAAGLVAGLQVHTVSDVAHLLAAGAWLGALPGFVVLLGRALPLDVTAQVAQRFSTLGVASVGTLFVSGVVNTWYLVGDVPALVGTDYGRLLLAKLALFAAMVALAAVNRLQLTARLNVRDPMNLWALRSLRRNATVEIAIGLIVIAIVGLLGIMVPAAHQSPAWPFGYTLSWQAAQQSFGVGVVVVVAGIVACVAIGAAVIGVLRHQWRLWTAGIVGLIAVAATWAWFLAVPAYPTTYAWSPVNYTADSIARGANLYAQNCGVCHGPYGRGDGPAALSLPIMPADLAAHGSIHRVGELFWWIAHGIPGTPMPAFAPRLNDAEIWDLVQFLRAQSDAMAATTLTNHVQPWLSAIVAPDFPFELAGQEQASLRQPQGNPVTLLVLYTLPQSLPYLRALVAEASTFGEIGVRVIAVPLSGSPNSTATEPPGAGTSIVAMTSADAIKAYAMFARQDIGANAPAPTQVDYLIDRQGYVRARWIGVPDSPSLRTAEVFDQADILRRERQRAPVPAGHTH